MPSAVIEVQIEGSTGTRYRASFVREGDSLKTTCTCQAGEKKMHCKHRLSLFKGDITQVRNNSPQDLAMQISVLLRGTDVEEALNALGIAEVEAATASAKLKKAKKTLDRVMHQ